jgi:hypothetical protein
VDGKSRKFRFHHKITTDGVALALALALDLDLAPSLLFSMEVSL